MSNEAVVQEFFDTQGGTTIIKEWPLSTSVVQYTEGMLLAYSVPIAYYRRGKVYYTMEDYKAAVFNLKPGVSPNVRYYQNLVQSKAQSVSHMQVTGIAADFSAQDWQSKIDAISPDTTVYPGPTPGTDVEGEPNPYPVEEAPPVPPEDPNDIPYEV